MKNYAQLVRSSLQKVPRKLLCSLAAAAVVVTTLVTANPIAVSADERDPNVNPEINIQHYLYFSAVSLGKINSSNTGVTYKERTKNDWEDQPWDSTHPDSTDYGTVLPIYNTERRKAEKEQAIPTNGSGFQPEYGVVLNSEQKFSSHIRLKQLFLDEKANYLEKPQMAYMNRLYYSNQRDNANYTLREIWVSKPEMNSTLWVTQSTQQNQADFNVMEVPFKLDDKGSKQEVGSLDYTDNNNTAKSTPVYLRDPSRVTFTNNPEYQDRVTKGGLDKDASGNPLPTYFEKGTPNERLVIPVTEKTTIRFAFDPTHGTTPLDADFFDYDITDGYVYTDQNLTAESRHETSYQKQEKVQGGANPAQWETLYASTAQKGINSAANYSDPTKPRLAFGNNNTGTGLATQVATLDKVTNYINRFNNRNRGNPQAGTGSVFGLVQDKLDENENLQWSSTINAPDLFTAGAVQPGTTTPLQGKTDYTDNQYGLEFKRIGGTYALQSVQKTDEGATTGDLTKFQNTSGVWSNQFWPMDTAASYGTDGHDLKFGQSGTARSKRAARGAESVADPSLGQGINADNNGNGPANANFPPSDDGQNHNAYFGMKTSVDFVLDPGYAGPLRYYFYGDDDLFVYLSEVDKTTKKIKPETTQLVADIGGVHSSVGMYVNLWQYIGQPIPYKTDSGENSETKEYRLSIFYDERGSSGSSCYMRFTVPFESITPREMEYTGIIQVEKEVKGSQNPDEEYSFRIDLKYPYLLDGTPVTDAKEQFDDCSPLVNRYKYEIWERGTDGNDTLIRQSVGDPATDTDDDYVYNGKVMKLKHNQYLKVFGLPGQMVEATDEKDPDADKQEGEVPTATLYRVTELDPEGRVTTTFASGKVNPDGSSEIGTDYEPGKVVMGTTQAENYVKYINASEQGTLTLNKVVDEADPAHQTTDPFTFEVDLKVPEGSQPLTSLPILRNNMEEADLTTTEAGKFEVTLNWNADKKQYDTVTLYNIPINTAFAVTETESGNYLPSDITVTGGVDTKTNLSAGMAQGIIGVDGPVTDANMPFVTVNYTNVYAPNTTAQIVVKKTIDGRAALEGGETFTFQLEGANDEAIAYLKDNSPLLAQATVKEGEKTASAEFAPMNFTHNEIGEYLFNVTEVGSGSVQNGLKYDDTQYQVKVTVQYKLDADGNPTQDLEAVVSWSAGTNSGIGSNVEFVNRTELAAEASIDFTKNVQGQGSAVTGVEGDVYTFTIDAGENTPDAPLPKDTKVTITNDGRKESYNGSFGPISYTRKDLGEKDADKVYEYVIREEKGNVDGLITDGTQYLAKVIVSKTTVNGVDQLTAALDSVSVIDGEGAADKSVVFTNIYRRAEAVINVRKILDGRPMRDGEVFTFELLEKDSSKVLQTLVLKGVKGESAVEGSFEPIEFKTPASRDYVVREVKGSDPDITYDENEHAVTVKVTEDENKSLQAAVSYDGQQPDAVTALNITNIWNTYTDWAPPVTKQTIGGSPAGYNFQMQLAEAEGASLTGSDKATSDETGKITFAPIRFTKAGNYKVTVSEVPGTDGKIIYDEHKVTFDLTVKANPATGLLSVEEAVENDESTVFTNDAGLRLTKTIVAGTDVKLTEDDYAKKFTFSLSMEDAAGKDLNGSFQTVVRDVNQTILDDGQTVITNGKGTIALSHGQTAYIYGLPTGTKYTIAEKQEEGWFNVESLSNKGEIGPGADMTASFTNVKMSTDTSLILGYKALTGTDGMNKPGLGLNSFKFQITPKSAAVEDIPVVPAPKTDEEENKPADSESEPEPKVSDAEPSADKQTGETTVQEIALPRIVSKKIDLAPQDIPMPENGTVVSSSETGEINFGRIEFTRAGTYVYEVTEIDRTDSEIGYSDKVWTITITVENVVTNNQVTGVKVTNVEYKDNEGNTSGDGFNFTNVFNGTPDLELHKSMSINGGTITDVKDAQPVNAGDSVTYYLTASVPGTATAAARDVVITDVMPAPVGDAAAELTLIDKGTASYNEADKRLTWNVGDIGVNKAVTVSWTVRVPAATADTLWTNIAAANYENNPDNPKDPDQPRKDIPSNEVTVKETPALPNVTIHKAQSVNKPGAAGVGGFSDSADPVMSEQGSLVVYELKVTNSGTAAAKNVVVSDVIPASEEENLRLEFVQAYDGGTFDKGEQTVTWKIPELAPGASAWVHFSVKIPAASKWNTWTNKATVTHQDPKDPDKEIPPVPSNEVTVETDVPALTIKKEQKLNDDEPFTQEILHARDKDVVTYKLTIANTSKVEAKDVVLKDKVPTGTPETPLIVIPESIQGGNLYADGTIVWNLGTIPAGESREVTFQVRVPYVKELTKWLNVATVNYSNNPAGPDKPQESNKVEVDAKAPKLSLEKFQNFEDGQPVKTPLTSLGEEEVVTYTLRAVNEGEFTAENVIITDEIPAGTTLVKDSISNGGKERNGVIEWNVGNIEPGQANAKTVSFQVKLDPITVATTWRNGASAVYDNNPDNPTDPKDPKTPVDSNIVEIEGNVPALSIVKSQQKNEEAPATPILVEAGDTITYSLTVSNNGKAAAKDVIVKDPVPEGLALIESSISDGGTVKDGVITWKLGTIGVGGTKTVTFQVTVPKVTEPTTWINAASTTYSNRENPEDPIPSNEVESRTDVPHLKIEKEQEKDGVDKTKDPMEVNGGDIVTYYVTVTNDGNGEAKDVKVTDTVPEGLTLVEDSISDKGTVKNGLITWKLGTLAKGEKRTVSFKVNVPEEQGMWRNIAYTSYPNNPDNEDPDNPKEEPSNPVDIIEWPEEGPKLLIDKTQALNNGTLTSEVLKGKAGDVVTYALTVRNVGKSTAEGITVSDVVPAGLSYVDGSASHDAVYENGKLTWFVETLEPGISVTLMFQAKLPMDNAAGSWKNIAKLTYQNDPEGPDHETPSNEVEVKKDPNKVPTTSTNGKPHPGASAPTATDTGILTWTLLAAGAAAGAAGLGVAGGRRRKQVSRKRK